MLWVHRLAHCLGHLRGHGHSHSHAHHVAHHPATIGVRCRLTHGVGRLVAGIAVHVANVVEESTLLNSSSDTARHGGGDLLGQGNRHHHVRYGQAILVVNPLGHKGPQALGELDLATLQVDGPKAGLGDHVGEGQHNDSTNQLGDLVQLNGTIGTDDFAQEDRRILDLDHTQTVGPDLHHLEIGVPDGDRTWGSPTKFGDRTSVDEVHLGAEGAVEAMLPTLECGEKGKVLRR